MVSRLWNWVALKGLKINICISLVVNNESSDADIIIILTIIIFMSMVENSVLFVNRWCLAAKWNLNLERKIFYYNCEISGKANIGIENVSSNMERFQNNKLKNIIY